MGHKIQMFMPHHYPLWSFTDNGVCDRTNSSRNGLFSLLSNGNWVPFQICENISQLIENEELFLLQHFGCSHLFPTRSKYKTKQYVHISIFLRIRQNSDAAFISFSGTSQFNCSSTVNKLPSPSSSLISMNCYYQYLAGWMSISSVCSVQFMSDTDIKAFNGLFPSALAIVNNISTSTSSPLLYLQLVLCHHY